MSYWINHPFLRIAIAFALGILAARRGIISLENVNLLKVLIFPVLILSGKILFKKIPNAFWGNSLLLIMFFIGILHYQQFDHWDEKKILEEKWTKCNAYIGTITSFPTEKENFITHHVDLELGIQDSALLKLPAKLLLYERKNDSTDSPLNYGDKIRIEGTPSIIGGIKNPYEFDYSKYMGDQHIFLQKFATSSEIKLIKKHQANDVMSAVYRIRSHFENIIKTQIKGNQEEAIILALLLGIKGQLDTELQSAYAAAGAMHVLAVSGLHVSIIYFLLNWLFRGIPNGDLKRFVTPAVSIMSLWTYALLTGFSPSILRAVTMFSIIIFAKVLDRKGQVFNSLAFSAFILLVVDPSFLFNVGFQLSFLAVAGIVYLYPRLHNIWNTKHPVGEYIWKLICVSLAAQVSTFPLSLYYFHQFPSYFLLANLIVIPVAYIIMILGITLLFAGTYVSWFGQLLEWFVSFMNRFVAEISHLKGSVIEWLYISEFQTWLIYMIILTFLALFKSKKFSYAWVILILASGLSLNRSMAIVKQFQNEELIFYSTHRSQTIDYVKEFHANLLTTDSSSILKNVSPYVDPYRIHHFLPPSETPSFISNRLMDFATMEVLAGKKILFITKSFDTSKIQFRLKTEIVVISHQAIDSLSNLDQIIDFQDVIIDNTNSPYYTNQMKSEAQNLGMRLFSLHDQAHQVSLSRDKKLLNMLF